MKDHPVLSNLFPRGNLVGGTRRQPNLSEIHQQSRTVLMMVEGFLALMMVLMVLMVLMLLVRLVQLLVLVGMVGVVLLRLGDPEDQGGMDLTIDSYTKPRGGVTLVAIWKRSQP